MVFWNKKKNGQATEKTLSQNDIRKLLIDLKLPPIILQLFDGNLCDDIANSHFLSDRYKAPYMFIDCPSEQLKHYNVDRYIPFLSIYQSTMFAYDKNTNLFVSYSVEYFREDELERLTWDELFTDEIRAWWEDEWPAADIIHVGGLLGLQYTKELIEKNASHDESCGEKSYPDSVKHEVGKVKLKKPIGYWSSSNAVNIGQVYGELKTNCRYCVIKEFKDCDSYTHTVGEKWTFLAYSLSPYDGGLQWIVTSDYTVEWMIPLYLAIDEFSKISNNISDYIVEIE